AVATVVPVVTLAMVAAVHHLADEDRRSPLGQEKQRKARGDGRPGLAVIQPRAVLALLADQELAAFAIPVMFAEESLAGQPASPLDAVQAVKGVPGQAHAEVVDDPLQGPVHGPGFVVLPAVGHGAV